MNRRQFTRQAGLASALIASAPLTGFSYMAAPQSGSIGKGIMWGSIGYGTSIMEKFQAAKAAGFEGVEPNSHLDRKEVLKAAEATGLKIPSVCGSQHWKAPLSHADPKVREQGLEALKVTIEDAKAYGADTILLVPGRVDATVSYDDCWQRTTEEIMKAVPLAESYNIRIAIENVWNNFLLSPLEAAYYIDQFNSQAVGFYFDCGNVLVYGWPEQWIRILGKRIAKVHIKEYSKKIADTQGKSAGFKVKLLDGDVNWQEVMKALVEIGYNSWATVEMPGGNTPEGLKDLCDRLGKILSS
ncbi:MAG TPA: sugar phosphate isomerase/epimerase family protein [Bacteroidales bacterium]|nr:sugar phosphate isomerase/epimerase family protein [Bacteroidales bacterium]HPF02372.1 sugar phosphate isomerase/epimerase family protein [Bacteroidales bacterium]HPJ58945.1 sugar phosphate isomerase/epimerase family protein [Bacteroidales bacterium]HPR12199.1 sugar phosphate isomerase/epimerase family protein [Bacteroidales bacterium]HRW84882.1 sugar phosphate isomerase/epimerase family protein [Bacteroidales bacterium]